jgi:hypothetical protein
MKVRCLYNTGEILLDYQRIPLGTSIETRYGQLEINKEYLVMGIIIGQGILSYLVDDGGIISACPYQLFDVIDNKLSSNWFFRDFKKSDDIFPYQEAVWGYYELCFEETHYEGLIDMEEKAHRTYFRRKIEIENEFEE